MDITIELIFAVVTAVLTGIAGVFTKNSKIPDKYIPIQNLIIGVVAAVVAVYFKLFDNYPVAIFVSLAIAFGVGGAYDLAHGSKKDK